MPVTSREPARVSRLFIGIYALAYTGIWLALLTPIVVTIALRVRELTPESASQKLASSITIRQSTGPAPNRLHASQARSRASCG